MTPISGQSVLIHQVKWCLHTVWVLRFLFSFPKCHEFFTPFLKYYIPDNYSKWYSNPETTTVRAATATAITPTNNHPFTFGIHTIMHNGKWCSGVYTKLYFFKTLSFPSCAKSRSKLTTSIGYISDFAQIKRKICELMTQKAYENIQVSPFYDFTLCISDLSRLRQCLGLQLSCSE